MGIRTPASDDDPGLEDFKNSIRVRCGVTVVESVGASTVKGGVTYSKLRMKFAADGPADFALRKYIKLISSIKGVRAANIVPNSLKAIKASES